MGVLSYIKAKTIINLTSYIEYRFSTIAVLILDVIFGFTSVFITYSIYSVTEKGLPDWTFYEITFMIGIYYLIKGLYNLFFSLDDVSYDIRDGSLDHKLVEPLNILLQYYRFNIESFSDVIAAVVMFIISVPNISLNLSFAGIAYFIVLLLVGFLSIFSIKLLTSSLSFFITENQSLVQGLNDIRSRFSSWPMTIYPKSLQLLFTFIFPIAFISFVPASFIMGKEVSGFFWLSPVAVLIFTAIAVKFFYYGLSKYSGTGS